MNRADNIALVLEVAKAWKSHCFVQGGSMFTEDSLWRFEYFEELRINVIEKPDEGNRNFEEKLRDQLQSVSIEGKCLWAELTWLYYLLVDKSKVGRARKLESIKLPWELSGRKLSASHFALGDVLEAGPISPGTYYSIQRWYVIEYIIDLMLIWTRFSETERLARLNDPWEFARWVDAQVSKTHGGFRHGLLYMLFPEYFIPSMSPNHKRDIVKCWRDDSLTERDIDGLNPVELDEHLYRVTQRLRDEYDTTQIDYYESPIREQWLSTKSNASTSNPDEEWYRKRFGTTRVWVIAPGSDASKWSEFLNTKSVRIGFSTKIGHLRHYDSRVGIENKLAALSDYSPRVSSIALWRFHSQMNPGDLLLAKKGTTEALGLGRISGAYTFDGNTTEFPHCRPAEWYPCEQPVQIDRVGRQTLILFESAQRYKLVRTVFSGLDQEAQARLLESDSAKPSVEAVSHPKNLIIQGPPGTGKTWMAESLAVEIIDGHSNGAQYDRSRYSELVSDGRISFVTFHQNYAYEEFIEGIRPVLPNDDEHTDDQPIEYELRTGLFKDLCDRAGQAPDRRFVLIIDEINRGNVAKIFGELITLIEDSRRLEAKHSTTAILQYSGAVFGVPNNLYIVGTMNTADRSIQLLDTALRRRFRFQECMPDPDHDEIQNSAGGIDLSHLLRTMNNRISVLLDREHQIGHTYFFNIKTVAELAERFKYQIFPLLQEYFFDDWSKINLVLGDNDFVTKRKIKDLGLGEITDEIDPVRYERRALEDDVWTHPEQYRKIYQSKEAD